MERTPNKGQHTKLTLEMKILLPLLPGFELATFRSRVRRSNQQVIQALVTGGGFFLACEILGECLTVQSPPALLLLFIKSGD